jgi:hypothetical protein
VSSIAVGGALLPDKRRPREPSYVQIRTLPEARVTQQPCDLDPDAGFAAIATELQPLRSLGVYHVGMLPPGGLPLPDQAAFRIDPPVPTKPYQPPQPIQGFLLGYFGRPGEKPESSQPTHVVAVNLDYKQSVTTAVVGPGPLSAFDAATGTWSPAADTRAELQLPPGGAKLLRLAPKYHE